MKIYLKDLVNIADQKSYEIDFKEITIDNNIFIRRLINVKGDATFYYDVSDKLRINYQIVGTMVCPDAYTLDDALLDFDLSEDEEVTKDEDYDGFYMKEDIELKDLVLQIILPEVPIKVVKNEKIEYSRGDGWTFVSEEEFHSSKEKQVDPRLQKLSEFKFEEGD